MIFLVFEDWEYSSPFSRRTEPLWLSNPCSMSSSRIVENVTAAPSFRVGTTLCSQTGKKTEKNVFDGSDS